MALHRASGALLARAVRFVGEATLGGCVTAGNDTTGVFSYARPAAAAAAVPRAERDRLVAASRYEPVLQQWRHRCADGLVDETGKIRSVFTRPRGQSEDNVTRVIREINQVPEAVEQLEAAVKAQDALVMLTRDLVEMPVYDARQLVDPSLDDNGFQLLDHRSAVTDWQDDREVSSIYYGEIEALVQRLTGARRTFSNNHLRRQSEPPVGGNGPLARLLAGSRGPAQVVHNDFAEGYGEAIIRTVASGGVPHTQTFGLTAPMVEAGVTEEELRDSRILVINTWRSVIDEPLQRFPIGLVDRRTIDRDRLHTSLIGKAPSGQPRGGIEVLNGEHDPDHRWYYYPKLTSDEVVVWKGYDSAEAPARPNLHSAFDDPLTPPDAPQRMSIEVRVLCLLD